MTPTAQRSRAITKASTVKGECSADPGHCPTQESNINTSKTMGWISTISFGVAVRPIVAAFRINRRIRDYAGYKFADAAKSACAVTKHAASAAVWKV